MGLHPDLLSQATDAASRSRDLLCSASRSATRPVPARRADRSRPFPAALVLAVLGLVVFLGLGSTGLRAQEETTGGVREFDIAPDGTITLAVNEETGVPVPEFIKLAQRITGRLFHVDEATFNQSNLPTINFVGTVRLPREAFFDFFQTMLYIEGFAIILRGGEDFELIEVVQLTGPKRADISAGARYVPYEELESYRNQTGVQIQTTMPFEHINATGAVAQTRPFFAQAGAGAGAGGGLALAPIGEDGRALLIQGYAPQVYQAAQLLRFADLPPTIAPYETRIVKLEYAAGEELEQILSQVLENRAQNAIRPGAGATGGAAARSGSQITVLNSPATNSLIVAGDPERVLEALDLVARLDVPIELSSSNLQVIELKNVLAEDLETVLRNFIREDQQANQQAQQGQGNTIQNQQRQTVIVAHPESNSLLVSGTKSTLQNLQRMVTTLDRRQPQVLVQAALVELSTDDADTIGVELGLLDIGGDDFNRPFGFTSFGLTTFEDTDADGLPDTRLPDFDNPLLGLTGGILSSDDFAIPLVVNLLETDERANILSLPSVVVNNNETAVVETEENRPTQQNNIGNATTTTGVGDPRVAGIVLNISPSISTNDYLRLNIELRVSRFTTAADPVTGGVTVGRSIRTSVTLPSEATMVLGGVIEDSVSDAESGIPFLKDIPIIGWLFKTQSSQQTRTNLYFFVTPTILDEEDFTDLQRLSTVTKLEAAEYIGNRRMRIVDPLWQGPRNPRLEDPETGVDEIDRYGPFETPFLFESERTIDPNDPAILNGTVPIGPGLDANLDRSSRNGSPTGFRDPAGR